MLSVTSPPHTFPAAPLSSLTLIRTGEQSSHPLDCPLCVTDPHTSLLAEAEELRSENNPNKFSY